MAVDKLIDSAQLDSALGDIADAIRAKSGSSGQIAFPNGFVSAIENIPSGGGSTLITKNISVNGTYSAEDDDADGYSEVTVNVPAPSPNLQAKTNIAPTTSSQTIQADAGYDGLSSVQINAMPSGTAGTPTATKGAVSNHSVSVTPSVTNTTGYITGSTKTGTAVMVTASELVSGSNTVDENGTYDVTNLAELVVDVSGSSTVTVATATTTLASTGSSIQFTGLSGNPTSFVITSSANVATNTNGVAAVVFDGTGLHGQTLTTQVTASTAFTKTYSSGTLTITASSASFQANEYKLVYTYGGDAEAIHTADVQVGSGASSITFAVTGVPLYWSCIFKSDFGTSSGYQRVIAVANDGASTYGLAMDSTAKAVSAWTASQSGGNLTITSQGTNNGGYFHQPGYYQLTYAVDASAPIYQTKSAIYTPTTSQQTESVTADSGYTALGAVNVTVNAIPSQYVVPTGNLSITSNGSNINVANYATVSVNVSSGSSKAFYAYEGLATRTANAYGATSATVTVTKAGTYNISYVAIRGSSSGTMGTNLYIGGTGKGNQQTFNNGTYGQYVSYTNQSIAANTDVTIYATSGSTTRSLYVGQLIVQEV